jgi:[acyl-carrier-protein] S-malonyltransferase
MGRALAERNRAAADVFAQADGFLGFPLSQLCWHGPASELDDTLNTQPALLTHSIAILRALESRYPGLSPASAAGHSMGEFGALVAAGSLTFEAALRLVRERARAMQAAGNDQPGGMAAILGLDLADVEAVCAEASQREAGVVTVANDNCPGQIVISGHAAALSAAIDLLYQRGARKVIRLAVSIAAHSPLMVSAQEAFNRALHATAVAAAGLPVIGNVHAQPLTATESIRADLEAQLTSRVRWTESVRAMIASGITTFLELGPGSVLTGLVRRIDRSVTAIPVDTPESLAALAA